MNRGATIQFRIMLKPIWTQIARLLKTWCKDSYFTLQRIGYIMTRSPTAASESAKTKEKMSERV